MAVPVRYIHSYSRSSSPQTVTPRIQTPVAVRETREDIISDLTYDCMRCLEASTTVEAVKEVIARYLTDVPEMHDRLHWVAAATGRVGFLKSRIEKLMCLYDSFYVNVI